MFRPNLYKRLRIINANGLLTKKMILYSCHDTLLLPDCMPRQSHGRHYRLNDKRYLTIIAYHETMPVMILIIQLLLVIAFAVMFWPILGGLVLLTLFLVFLDKIENGN